jgi:hypothetical protein
MEQRIPFSILAIRYFRSPFLGAGTIFLITIRQAGLLASGSSYSLHLPVPPCGTVVCMKLSSPVTAAGP